MRDSNEETSRLQGRVGDLTADLEGRGTSFKAVYGLEVGGTKVTLNDQIGRGVSLFLGEECRCTYCSLKVGRLYGGGYCYACFNSLARCDLCILSPERCHLHLGTCREPAWAEEFCMQPHVVYLSNTSAAKIGITRRDRTHRRWMEQGAKQAMVVAHMPSRRAAGVVEAHFKRTLNDRTDWRQLVSGAARPASLLTLAGQLQQAAPSLDRVAHDGARDMLSEQEIQQMQWRPDATVTEIGYPVTRYSPAVRMPLSRKTPVLRDNLQGVIGRYLLFGRGVLNLGDFRGRALDIEIGPAFEQKDLGESDQMSLFD